MRKTIAKDTGDQLEGIGLIKVLLMNGKVVEYSGPVDAGPQHKHFL